MGLLLDGQFVAGCIEITLIGSALAHIVAGIGGGHLRDDQSVALLLLFQEEGANEFQLVMKDFPPVDLTCMLAVSGAPSARSQITSV